MKSRTNVLLIVIDQLRADCVAGALARYVRLPNIRSLAADAVDFRSHFTVTSPCGPSRASLLTGKYAMNHGAVRNRTPLRHDTPTLGTEARRAGYDPLLFGYTDTSQDPRVLGAEDPRLHCWEEVAAGFREVVRLRQDEDSIVWENHLRQKGYVVPPYPDTYRPIGGCLDGPAIYAAHDSDTAFLTDQTLGFLDNREAGWFALVTYIRPHPPFVAPEPYNQMYDPGALPSGRAIPNADWHPFLAPTRAMQPIDSMVEGFPGLEPTDDAVRQLRATYLGLATEVDHHIGRILDWLKKSGQYDKTLIILTGDHGEMLGDFGIWGKCTFHDAAFHIPLLIRDPFRPTAHGQRVDRFTESVDVAPTVLEFMKLAPPHTMDGRSLSPFLDGQPPADWRDTSFSELNLGEPLAPTHWQIDLGLTLDEAKLAVLRTDRYRLVQFAGNMDPILFDMYGEGEIQDLAAAPENAPRVLALTRRLLQHMMQKTEGLFSRTTITEEGVRVVG